MFVIMTCTEYQRNLCWNVSRSNAARESQVFTARKSCHESQSTSLANAWLVRKQKAETLSMGFRKPNYVNQWEAGANHKREPASWERVTALGNRRGVRKLIETD